MRKRLLCDARFELQIEVKGPMLIKAGEASLNGPDMAFVRTYAKGADKPMPYLPGPSLKGVFRSHLERIARTLLPAEGTPVCIPYEFNEKSRERSCGKRFKQVPKPQVYRDECLACRMFGSLQFKGRVFIEDAYPVDPGQIKLEVRHGVGIDRKTGGSAGGVLYDLEVVTAGTFQTSIVLDNFELWQLGALGLVLIDLQDERLRFGMGTSRGLGHVAGRIAAAELRYPAGTEPLLQGIGSLASKAECETYRLFASETRKEVKLPEPAMRGIWNVHRLGEEEVSAVFAAGRDEFQAFLKQYRWNGGPA